MPIPKQDAAAPCLKARGLRMRGLGIEARTPMYLGIGPELLVLTADPSHEAPSKAMVRFERTGSRWRLGLVG